MSNGLEPWIPYMGNKSRLLERLHALIHQIELPSTKVFVDLFCGGGSVGYSMAGQFETIVMNDLDSGIMYLHKTLRDHPERIALFSQVEPTKEEFNAYRLGISDYDTFVRQIYSFSTNGKAYLWGEERLNTPKEELNRQRSEPRERTRHLEDVILMYGRYEPKIVLENKPYNKVEIPEDAIVYCDPPYKGTADYCVGEFDHEEFYEWCRNCPNTVLISEYYMPDDFFLLEEWDLASQGGGNKNTKTARERLYCNKPIKKLSLF